MNIAIILASGMGKRMGTKKNKMLLELGGKPLIFYAIDNFERSTYVDKIILVVREDELDTMRDIVEKYRFIKVVHITCGREERQHSGHNGVRCVEKNFENGDDIILLFHNGANPFVTNEEIGRVIVCACEHGAAVVAHKTKDTIRRVDLEGLSRGVVDRSDLWNMQTPQAMQFVLARDAFNVAHNDNFLGTDDVSLVERLGKKVMIVEASDNNFKVTTPIDLALAEVILQREF